MSGVHREVRTSMTVFFIGSEFGLVPDTRWRLRLWATDALESGNLDRSRGFLRSAEEVERLGQLCWSGFDVERHRHPAPLVR